MLQELIKIISELQITPDKYGGYQTVSTGFFKQGAGSEKLTRIDMPQNEKEYKAVIRKDTPIIDLTVDPDDPEISLITKYLSPEENEQSTPLHFGDLYERMKTNLTDCAEYEVLSSSWVKLDAEHTGRVDFPIIAVLVDEEGKKEILGSGLE